MTFKERNIKCNFQENPQKYSMTKSDPLLSTKRILSKINGRFYYSLHSMQSYVLAHEGDDSVIHHWRCTTLWHEMLRLLNKQPRWTTTTIHARFSRWTQFATQHLLWELSKIYLSFYHEVWNWQFVENLQKFCFGEFWQLPFDVFWREFLAGITINGKR